MMVGELRPARCGRACPRVTVELAILRRKEAGLASVETRQGVSQSPKGAAGARRCLRVRQPHPCWPSPPSRPWMGDATASAAKRRSPG